MSLAKLKAKEEKKSGLAAFRKPLANTKLILEGDVVRIEWEYDPAYGNGKGSFVGMVQSIDDWIDATNTQGVRFYYPIKGKDITVLKNS